jgi:hypothetical protein
MLRISLPYIYGLAVALEPLAKITVGQSVMDYVLMLFPAQQSLETLLRSSLFSPALRSSRPFGEHLLTLLNEKANRASYEGQTMPADVYPITTAFTEFKTAFIAELQTLPSFFVTQKGSHDTLTLLDQAWRIFPSDLASKVPEAMFDVGEAGKALCYEVPTACGFHIFRATETVLRRYYTHVTGGKPQPKIRNIAVYINAMRQRNCGDERILSVLEQMSKLHRNPLIHPEVVLTVDEAISIVGIAHSAITSMLSVLPVIPPTTATPSTELSALLE